MMPEPTHPIVFVSHATEDKDRFVLAFATHLRKRGIDAWLDKWEIAPGDSLVDKIFEEGLKNAHAVIVVISAASVRKAWVREELNASVVARIQKGTRLIPVLIDDVAVPEALKNTVWIKVADLDNFGAELEASSQQSSGQNPSRLWDRSLRLSIQLSRFPACRNRTWQYLASFAEQLLKRTR